MMLVTTPYFSLVVLCYRSGHSIVPFVEKLRQVLSRCNFSWELVLVGNYMADSNDETPQVVRELVRQTYQVEFHTPNAACNAGNSNRGWIGERRSIASTSRNSNNSRIAAGIRRRYRRTQLHIRESRCAASIARESQRRAYFVHTT